MGIKGFIKTSFLDYDGHVSSVIFLNGCNFACKYCHNRELIPAISDLEDIPENVVWDWIKPRKNWIDALVVSGGEPFFSYRLFHLLETAKYIGIKTKVFTNGTYPRKMEQAFNSGIIDFVSMDIKSSINYHSYSHVAGLWAPVDLINQSIDLLLSKPGQHEFRTTVCYPSVFIHDIENISKRIKGADKYIIQNFKAVDDSPKHLKPYDYETLRKMEDVAKGNVKSLKIVGGSA